MQNGNSKKIKHYPSINGEAMKILIHPKSDPREPQEYSQSQILEKPKKHWSCCWPFSLCCGSRPKYQEYPAAEEKLDFNPTLGTSGHVPMNRDW